MQINIRERSQEIADCIKTKTRQSVRALAAATGFSKSSAGRHRQGIERRTQASGSDCGTSQLAIAGCGASS
jgi:hypothetical protein